MRFRSIATLLCISAALCAPAAREASAAPPLPPSPAADHPSPTYVRMIADTIAAQLDLVVLQPQAELAHLSVLRSHLVSSHCVDVAVSLVSAVCADENAPAVLRVVDSAIYQPRSDLRSAYGTVDRLASRHRAAFARGVTTS